MTDQTSAARRVLDLPIQLSICLTGGAATLVPQLLTLPGASHTVLSIAVPYGRAALANYLGRAPERFCSRPTAGALSATAWSRAVIETTESDIPEDERFPVGLAVTASLATDRPKRGDHRAHIALTCLGGSSAVDLTLTKNARSRSEEDAVVTGATIAATLAFFSDNPQPSFEALGLSAEDRVSTDAAGFPTAAHVVLAGIADAAVWQPTDTARTTDLTTIDDLGWVGVVSGSFNPRHSGHERLRDAAAAHLGGPVGWELPLRNADKPPLDAITLRDRLAGFDEPVILSRLARFDQKAEAMAGLTFVVGFDTAARVLDPRFVGSEAARTATLDRLLALDCRFLVADRLDDGTLRTADDLDAGRHRALFERLPGFREDISSTELRAGC